MARPVTLFTGQWADLPLETLAKKAAAWGFDGLELACWGDHFDAETALEKDSHIRERKDILARNNLKCFAISTHLIGQCVCDPIDERHRNVVPDRLWGDGKPEGAENAVKAGCSASAYYSTTIQNKMVKERQYIEPGKVIEFKDETRFDQSDKGWKGQDGNIY